MRRSRSGSRGGQSVDEFAGVAAPAAEEEVVRAVPASSVDHGATSTTGPRMSPGYERIITRVFHVDVSAEFEVLEGALKFRAPAHQLDYADLVDALDEAYDYAKRAHRIYVNGKVALEAFEFDVECVTGDMRAQASRALEEEKEKGLRRKAITDADVEAWMAAKFPDEYRSTREQRAKAKRMVEHLERVSDLWKSRCGALDTMVKGSRRL